MYIGPSDCKSSQLPPVTVEAFMNLVGAKIPSKWYLFGMALGIPQSELDTYPADRCLENFARVFASWVRNDNPDLSWKTVIDKLESPMLREKKLAATLREMFSDQLPPQLKPSTCAQFHTEPLPKHECEGIYDGINAVPQNIPIPPQQFGPMLKHKKPASTLMLSGQLPPRPKPSTCAHSHTEPLPKHEYEGTYDGINAVPQYIPIPPQQSRPMLKQKKPASIPREMQPLPPIPKSYTRTQSNFHPQPLPEHDYEFIYDYVEPRVLLVEPQNLPVPPQQSRPIPKPHSVSNLSKECERVYSIVATKKPPAAVAGEIYSDVRTEPFPAVLSKSPDLQSVHTIPTTGNNDTFRQTVTSENITELRELGVGLFGKVVLAQTNNLSLKDMGVSDTGNDRNISISVVMKNLWLKCTNTQRGAFEKEIHFMSCLKHPNVVQLLGMCYYKPAFLIMEYTDKGYLNKFLQQCSKVVQAPSNISQLATSMVVHMATQIASGMRYIASKRMVNRDLASRNCLVGEGFIVKIADFSMCRYITDRSNDYQLQPGSDAFLPVRWIPTECFYGRFSEKSDVWAFGITMWELFTLAKDVPYPDLTEEQVIEDAVNNSVYRKLHPKPDACPQSVYEIMLQCWDSTPRKRAPFKVLHEMLEKLPQNC